MYGQNQINSSQNAASGGSGDHRGGNQGGGLNNQRGIFMRNDRMRDNTVNRDQALQHWNTIKDAIQKIYA